MEIAIAVLVVVSGLASLVLLRRVHREVKTLKDQLTIGEIVGQGESRRIEGLAADERTTREQRHLDHEALKEAPGGDDGGQGR